MRQMILTHRIELDPTEVQKRYFLRACGVARFCHNWGLSEWKRRYAAGEKPSENSLRKHFNSIKRVDFPWALEVTYGAEEQAFANLGRAFQNFFAKRARYPRFKKKGVHESFRAGRGVYTKFDGRRIRFPTLGWVKSKEGLRFSGTIKNVTVTRVAGHWFACVPVEIDPEVYRSGAGENQAVIGVDLGIKTLATCSDGVRYANPRALQRRLRRLRLAQRRVSRKQKGSRNRSRACARLAVQHYRVRRVRQDAIHKATTDIVRRGKTVVVEDLNVRGMLQNRRLARAIGDASFYEFRRQLDYKSKLYGVDLIVADRFFPSTKTCSGCGAVQETSLSQRIYRCEGCGLELDRDLNAARNLAQYVRPIRPELTPVETGVRRAVRKAARPAGRRSRNLSGKRRIGEWK